MVPSRAMLASQFWNQDVESSRSPEAVVKSLPYEPPPLPVLQTSGLARCQQLWLLQQLLPVPFTPSYSEDDDGGGGWVADRVLASVGGQDWWATLTGRMRLHRFIHTRRSPAQPSMPVPPHGDHLSPSIPAKANGIQPQPSSSEDDGHADRFNKSLAAGRGSSAGVGRSSGRGRGRGGRSGHRAWGAVGGVASPELYVLSGSSRLRLGPHTSIAAGGEVDPLRPALAHRANHAWPRGARRRLAQNGLAGGREDGAASAADEVGAEGMSSVGNGAVGRSTGNGWDGATATAEEEHGGGLGRNVGMSGGTRRRGKRYAWPAVCAGSLADAWSDALSSLRAHVTLRHKTARHEVAASARVNSSCVDRRGHFWTVPQSLSLDVASLAAWKGVLRYRAGVHHMPHRAACQTLEPHTDLPEEVEQRQAPMPVLDGAPPGTHMQAVVTAEGEVTLWKNRCEDRRRGREKARREQQRRQQQRRSSGRGSGAGARVNGNSSARSSSGGGSSSHSGSGGSGGGGGGGGCDGGSAEVGIRGSSSSTEKCYNVLAARPRITLSGLIGGIARYAFGRRSSSHGLPDHDTSHSPPRSNTNAAAAAAQGAAPPAAAPPAASADLFACVGVTAQLGLFERPLLDHTLASAHLSCSSAPAFASAIAWGLRGRGGPLAGMLDCAADRLQRASLAGGAGVACATSPTLTVTLQQQVIGPIRARYDGRFAVNFADNTTRSSSSSSSDIRRNTQMLQLQESVYSLDCSLEKLLGAVRLVVWYSPTRREGMAEVRLLER